MIEGRESYIHWGENLVNRDIIIIIINLLIYVDYFSTFLELKKLMLTGESIVKIYNT